MLRQIPLAIRVAIGLGLLALTFAAITLIVPPRTPLDDGPHGSSMPNRPTLPATARSNPRISVEVLRVWFEPFTSVSGTVYPVVLIEWRNTSEVPIRAVWGTIQVTDRRGRTLALAEEQCIYAGRPIRPGDVVTEAGDEGWLILDYVWGDDISATARFSVTRIDETLPQ